MENELIPIDENGKPVWENEIRTLLRDFRCTGAFKDVMRYVRQHPKTNLPGVTGEQLYDIAMQRCRTIIKQKLA